MITLSPWDYFTLSGLTIFVTLVTVFIIYLVLKYRGFKLSDMESFPAARIARLLRQVAKKQDVVQDIFEVDALARFKKCLVGNDADYADYRLMEAMIEKWGADEASLVRIARIYKKVDNITAFKVAVIDYLFTRVYIDVWSTMLHIITMWLVVSGKVYIDAEEIDGEKDQLLELVRSSHQVDKADQEAA